ncbi:uncharacterized protein [Venturia canescens]|nr:uncharacterized protein LOC122414249 isoform X2 [Venturia canescens]XP_043281275.1 uncharacterized protein LOC122414249 isoform X2 [Venturia canescens]
MVRLTEEMVVARTRVSDLTAVRKLNCWGTELTDVSILRNLKKVEVLSLSVNNINTLNDFQYCLNLRDLFVRKNNIKDLNEVCYLQNLLSLRNLWLDENPCAEQEGYRLAVLRALPNLEKLDDKVVTTEEIQNALARGRILVHPLDMDASPTCSDTPSPEEVIPECSNDADFEQRKGYNSSGNQTQGLKHQQGYSTQGQRIIHDYQENDRRNANWCASPTFQYNQPQNNHFDYEEYDDQELRTESERFCRRRRHSSGNGGENTLELNSRRSYPYSDNGENEAGSRRSNTDRQIEAMPAVSPRTSYPPTNYPDERREPALVYDEQQPQHTYQDRRHPLESDQQLPKRSSASLYQNNSIVDRDETSSRNREMTASQGGWVRHSEKDKCNFYYHRRPVTRNSNILSAVLCLVKELDYPSLEVVEMAVRNRMDELEE